MLSKETKALLRAAVKRTLREGSYNEGETRFYLPVNMGGKFFVIFDDDEQKPYRTGGDKKMLDIFSFGGEFLYNYVNGKTNAFCTTVSEFNRRTDSCLGENPSERFWRIFCAKALTSYAYAYKEHFNEVIFIPELGLMEDRKTPKMRSEDFVTILAIIDDERRKFSPLESEVA